MKKALMIIGAIAVLALVSIGSFWGGVTYQSNRLNQVRENFLRARGMPEGGQFPGGNLTEPGRFPGGTTGVIKTIAGDVVTLSTAQEVTNVVLSATTRVEKYQLAATSDLKVGMRVQVIGEQDQKKGILASRIVILNQDISNPASAEPMETEP